MFILEFALVNGEVMELCETCYAEFERTRERRREPGIPASETREYWRNAALLGAFRRSEPPIIARTYESLEVVCAITGVHYENQGGPFESIVSRYDISQRVGVSGGGLNTILERLVTEGLLCQYDDQAFYSITKESLGKLENDIEKYRHLIEQNKRFVRGSGNLDIPSVKD